MKEKLICVRILTTKKQADRVFSILLRQDYRPANEMAKSTDFEFKRIEAENPYEQPMAHLKTIQKYAGRAFVPQAHPGSLPANFADAVDEVYRAYKRFKRNRQMLLEQIEECEEGKKRFQLFGDLPVDLQALSECTFVKVRFGHMPIQSLNRIEALYKDDPFLTFFTSYTDAHDCWGIYFVPRNAAERIDAVFVSMLFESVAIPSASGSAAEAARCMEENISFLNRQVEQAAQEEAAYFEAVRTSCGELYFGLQDACRKYALLKNGLENDTSYILTGFFPKSGCAGALAELRSVENAFVTQLGTVKMKKAS